MLSVFLISVVASLKWCIMSVTLKFKSQRMTFYNDSKKTKL
jgi:hypothetical protein